MKRFAIVDDDPITRILVKAIMSGSEYRVDAYDSAEAFIASLSDDDHGCAVIDYLMPGMSGIQLQEYMSEIESRLQVVFLTGHADVPITISALKGGAVDLIEKPVDREEVLQAVSRAMYKDKIAERARKESLAAQATLAKLTPRELEVCKLMARGYSNRYIADMLEPPISPKTLEIHRRNVYYKTDAKSLIGLSDLLRTAQ